MDIFLVILFSYISGSIPFGFILTKTFSKTDIRKVGSGNIGATNVLRTGNKLLAALTLLLDTLKGFLPVLLTIQFYPEHLELSALLAFLGHIFPVWLKFKGGKGVATYFGILIALSYPLSFLFAFTWITILLIFKYSSLSSLVATFGVYIINFFRYNVLKSIDPTFDLSLDINLLLFIFFILIIFTHKKNISNLKSKTEEKIKI